MPKKFKSETAREHNARKIDVKDAKKKKTAKAKIVAKKMTNKEIGLCYIAKTLRIAMLRIDHSQFNTIVGTTLRGSRPEKIVEMMRVKSEKMLASIEKLLTKRGHEDKAHPTQEEIEGTTDADEVTVDNTDSEDEE